MGCAGGLAAAVAAGFGIVLGRVVLERRVGIGDRLGRPHLSDLAEAGSREGREHRLDQRFGLDAAAAIGVLLLALFEDGRLALLAGDGDEPCPPGLSSEKLAQAADEIRGRGARGADFDATGFEADEMDVGDELPVENGLAFLARQRDDRGEVRWRCSGQGAAAPPSSGSRSAAGARFGTAATGATAVAEAPCAGCDVARADGARVAEALPSRAPLPAEPGATAWCGSPRGAGSALPPRPGRDPLAPADRSCVWRRASAGVGRRAA